jgi:hypothetical protein
MPAPAPSSSGFYKCSYNAGNDRQGGTAKYLESLSQQVVIGGNERFCKPSGKHIWGGTSLDSHKIVFILHIPGIPVDP